MRSEQLMVVSVLQVLWWPAAEATSTSQRWNPVSDESSAFLSDVPYTERAGQCWRRFSWSLKNCQLCDNQTQVSCCVSVFWILFYCLHITFIYKVLMRYWVWLNICLCNKLSLGGYCFYSSGRPNWPPETLCFCCMMLCNRGLSHHAVCVCVCVCPPITFVNSVKTNKLIFKFFSLSGSQTILVFLYQTYGNIPTGTPLTEVVKCRWGRQKIAILIQYLVLLHAVNAATGQVLAILWPNCSKLWHLQLVVSGAVCW